MIGVLVIGVVNWLLNWARRILTVRVLGDVVLAMRTDAFRAVMSHDMSFFDQFQSARIVSRITSDTDEFSRVAVVLTDLLSQVLLVIILLAYLFTDQLAADADRWRCWRRWRLSLPAPIARGRGGSRATASRPWPTSTPASRRR